MTPSVGPGQLANRGERIRHQIGVLQQQRQKAKRYKPPTEGLSGVYAAGYEQNTNAARATRDNALAGANYQQTQLNNAYGFGQSGAVNPYSQAAQLQAQLAQANRTSVNSYAARGQLYSGALTTNALGGNAENYNKSYNALRTKYQDSMAKLLQSRNAAKTTFQNARSSAMQQAIQDQLKEDPDATAAPRSPYHSQKWYTKHIHALKRRRNR